MNYGIFRIAKLKTMANLTGSLKHARREQETPNADPNRLADNVLLTDTPTVQSVLDKYERLKPEKIRNDQVRAIEVLVTASPEAMAEMTREQRESYLKDALAFTNAEFGGERNLLHAEIHNDETTAHLTAFYIPLVTKKNAKSGKEKTGLNAKILMGDRKTYSDRQTRFHEIVSSKYGLERGEIGSKAKHTKVKDFYRQINLMDAVDDLTMSKIDEMAKTSVEVDRKGFFGNKTETLDVPPFVELPTIKNTLKPVLEIGSKNKFHGVQAKKREQEKRKREQEQEIAEHKVKLDAEYQERMQELNEKQLELNRQRKELSEKERNLREIVQRDEQQKADSVWGFLREFVKMCLSILGLNAKTYENAVEIIKNEIRNIPALKQEVSDLTDKVSSLKAEIREMNNNLYDMEFLENQMREVRKINRLNEINKARDNERSYGMRR